MFDNVRSQAHVIHGTGWMVGRMTAVQEGAKAAKREGVVPKV